MTETKDIKFVIGAVSRIEERTRRRWVRGTGSDAVTEEVSDGWFVVLGNGTSLGFGKWKPDCEVGEEILVSFRRSKS